MNRGRTDGRGTFVLLLVIVSLVCAQVRSAAAQAPPAQGTPAQATPAQATPAQATAAASRPTEINGVMVPSPAYFAALALYQAGQYRAAYAGFSASVRPPSNLNQIGSAIRSRQNPLSIDAICNFTMRGECHFQLGEYAAALQDYETAMDIHANVANWLQNLSSNNVGRGAQPGVGIPWGGRNTLLGDYPATVTSVNPSAFNPAFAKALPQNSLMPAAVTTCVQEILRCTCLSLYRWHQLMGPLRELDPFNRRLGNTYFAVRGRSKRTLMGGLVPRPANPWVNCWQAVESGMVAALWHRPAVARTQLTNAATLGGLDHPLTGYALLMLGHLELAEGNPVAAESDFLQASIAAAHYNDLAIVEEALRCAAELHLSAEQPAQITPLDPAIGWASTAGSPQLLATLQLLAAENDYQLDRPQAALARLNVATLLLAGTNLAEGRVGARLNYLRALVSYRLQDATTAGPALFGALAFQSKGSFWQFRAGMIDMAWQKRTINERQATELYATVLSDPSPVDWMSDPLEALSSQTIPHAGLFEHWFEAALARNDDKLALEIVELLKRHRFLSTLDLGGRLLNLRWVLEAPEAAIGEDALLQRGRLLARVPQYAEASRQARQIQRELRRLPLVPETPDEISRQNNALAELKHLSTAQEALLRQLALERQPCALVFPPLRTTEQLQAGLREGQRMLIFFEASKQLHGFVLTPKDNRHWKVDAPPARVSGRVKLLLTHLGNYGPNRPLSDAQLANERWRTDAEEIFSILFKGSNFDLAKPSEELVVVPDGDLWYLPFESLVAPQESQQSLISRLPLRYSPTAGLAVGDSRPHRSGRTLVVAGRASHDKEQVESDRLKEFQEAVERAEALSGKSPPDLAMLASLVDQLVVSQDIPRPGSPYGWQPMPRDGKQVSAPLSDWLALPWGGPDQASFLGFHSAAEGKSGALLTPANELFLSVCGLMGSGSRTVLISRWRTGGQTNYDLVREFARELPKSSASKAWQQAVRAVTAVPLTPEKEPRLKHAPGAQLPSAAHPFFWAGLLLADTGSPPAEE